MAEATIAVSGLSKSFRLSARQQRIEKSASRIREAVRDLSFEVRAGEIYGLLGPNGAGKTTTLRILATLINPDTGNATIAGKSIIDDPAGVRSAIGFLTSDLKLEDYFTPNYLFEFFATLHRIPLATARARREELFARFGIDEFAEVKVAELSQGMRQKTSLVVSLAHDPHIIIFDEPTNGLDLITARVVTDYLASLRDSGYTILLSTHIFSLVEKLCDRVGVIVEGAMVADGSLAEVSGEQSLEDAFFALYTAAGGEVA